MRCPPAAGQELGLAVNALSSARPAATLMLERSPHKFDTHRSTVDGLDLWQRLAERADAVGIPPPDLNPDAALGGGGGAALR